MKKNDAAVLVRGLGMAMSFLQALTEEIVNAGGFEEMVHFLSKDAARPLVATLAKQIVKSPWQIPRSLVQRLTMEASRRESAGDAAIMEWDSKFRWVIVLDSLGIPVVDFGDPKYDHRLQPVPSEIVQQLHGVVIKSPMIVAWDGEDHVVVNQSGGFFAEGVKYDAEQEAFIRLTLAPAKYFDLKR